MDEQILKTSWKQRIIIIIVAFLMIASTVLTYIFVVLSANDGSTTSDSDIEARIAELTEQFDAKSAELEEAAKPLSDKYFPDFSKYLKDVKAYNENTANQAILDTKDLQIGTGKELTEGDTDYLAYYIGWCADGTIFDSSLDDTEDPTALQSPLDPSNGLIEGWEQGVVGMKLGGIRQITMNGDLAYGDTQEICGGYNKPLKFIVMAIPQDETIATLNQELSDIYIQMYMAYVGASN